MEVDKMADWTLVVGDRPTLVFSCSAESQGEAEFWFDEDDDSAGIEENLYVFEDENGAPLWDGKSDLTIRRPNSIEHKAWRASYLKVLDEDKIEDGDPWVLFLMKVHDPTDDPTD